MISVRAPPGAAVLFVLGPGLVWVAVLFVPAAIRTRGTPVDLEVGVGSRA